MNMDLHAFVRQGQKLQWDYRLGGVPRLVFATDEELMQIPDEIRKCVAFLAIKKRKSGFHTGGTMFFVGYPLEGIEGSSVVYAVTARHVIEDIREHSEDEKVYCRLNTHQHGVQYPSIGISSWVFNADSQVDVAIAQLPLDFNLCDHKLLPVSMFLTDEICKRDNFGIGEDLFFPGLFTQRPGENANLPIVRIGNIAAMPEESVRTTWGVLPRAYLIEARSIGGLSGSPVFWNRGSIRQLTVGIEPPTGARLNFYFLGLIHGHYDIRGEDWDSNDETSIDTAAQTRALNMGIAIVIPASDVLATLNEPIFLDQREIIRREVLVQKRLSLPVPDVIAEVPDEMLIQNDTTARTHSLFDVSDSAPKDAGDLSPESKEPPMNP